MAAIIILQPEPDFHDRPASAAGEEGEPKKAVDERERRLLNSRYVIRIRHIMELFYVGNPGFSARANCRTPHA
jgi:hypothetical protein